jgi:DNA-binding MarR family transcriptional regulator
MLASKQVISASSPTHVKIQATSETETAAELRAVIGKLSRRLRPTAAAASAGLTPTRVSVLLSVVRGGAVRLSELAESEGINPTMLSRVVSDLAEAGLIERLSDEGDKRAVWVQVTAAGRGLAERMRRERTDAVKLALAGLSEGKRRSIETAVPALEALADELRRRPRAAKHDQAGKR